MYELLCVIVIICDAFVMLLFIVSNGIIYVVVIIIIIIDFCGNVWFSFNADVMLPNYLVFCANQMPRTCIRLRGGICDIYTSHHLYYVILKLV